MIAYLKGQIILKEAAFLIVETGGVGYRVAVTAETLSTIGTETTCQLWIHHVIREDSSDLYGFIDRESLDFFELLITISGIGPKTALGVLNASSIDNLKTAVSTGETSYLTKISGIGKKLAEKIVFELKEKIGPAEEGSQSKAMQGDADVLAALMSLGYGEREGREAIKKLPKDIEGTSNRVKAVLKVLGK
jgi:Holliday junction DNA helicase RuvA